MGSICACFKRPFGLAHIGLICSGAQIDSVHVGAQSVKRFEVDNDFFQDMGKRIANHFLKGRIELRILKWSNLKFLFFLDLNTINCSFT